MNRLRVATYNVHKCRGMDWRTRVPRVLKVMHELKTDVIACQEIFASQAHCVATGLNMRHVFGQARIQIGEPYGYAVFSRLPIIESEQFDLTVQGREPRRCLRVSLDPGPIQFFALHLGTSFFERRHQAARLLSEYVLERPEFKGSRIVVGDFNEWTKGLATEMLSRRLQIADLSVNLNRSRTYPGLLPFLHLDHIYYDPQFRLKDMGLHRTPAALVASDHLPLVACFTTNLDCRS
ncbi:MAG: Endonuclease/exonuclease/phosphatase [Bryobacterales bacterium]|nr:Endonuclease/exonuclease/phosphatase [Bryobacterales bacterium]